MAVLCYTQVNNSTTTYEGNTLLAYGVPGFLYGSGTLNTTSTVGVAHHQGPYDTRIDYRGGTVAPGQTASLSATFNATSAGLKGVYWFNETTPPNGTFVRDNGATPCRLMAVIGSESPMLQVEVENRTAEALTGSLQARFLRTEFAPDVNLARALLSGQVQGFVEPTLDPIQKFGGASLLEGALKLPPDSSLRLRGKLAAGVRDAKVKGALMAVVVIKITQRGSRPFAGPSTVLIGYS